MSGVPSPLRGGSWPHRVLIGAALWAGTLQFFLVEALVQAHWAVPYDRRHYYISDLGALHCAVSTGGRSVCSPWHTLMNASFVLQGLLIGGGALLLDHMWRRTSKHQASATTALLAIAGGGVALVGLAPEDVAPSLHVVGAAGNFLGGNAGLVMLFVAGRRSMHPVGAVWAGVLGTVGLAALAWFVVGADWGLGPGGIERVIAYPLPAGLPVVAVGVLFAVRRGKVAAQAPTRR
jgi:hypothetical membrane protein